MAIAFPEGLIHALEDPDTTKVLATIGQDGFPHLAVKQSLQLGEGGELIYLELLESSRSNRNMVRSIWFDRKVSIGIRGKGGRSYLIKGKPVKTHIAGPLFRRHYLEIREQLGDVDLAAVWVIEPEQVIDQSLSLRLAEEERQHPFFRHLDRLAR
jgi:uncharacterized protein